MRRILVLLLAAGPVYAEAPSGCPAAVTTAVMKAFPKATIGACKAEREHGKDRFEVKLTKSNGEKVELDITPDGTVLQVEEKIAVDVVPEAVKKAFGARYPKAKATGAQKQTAGKDVRYEIAFTVDSGRKEATFTADGTFVEEE
jgi:hypothetical protein